MIPKEKAQDLYLSMEKTFALAHISGIKLACLLCIDEVINVLPYHDMLPLTYEEHIYYWARVKEEIKALYKKI